MDVRAWYVRRGRIPRRVWWLQYVLPSTLAPVIAAWIGAELDLPVLVVLSADGSWAVGGGLPELVVAAALVVPWVSGAVARLHDSDHSAWWLLLGLVPLVGQLGLLAMLHVFRGDPRANRYGPPDAPLRRPRMPTLLRRSGIPA